MPTTKPYTLEAILSSLPGRILLVFLTVIVTSGTLSMVSGLQHLFSNSVFIALVVTALGTISGIAARLLLRRNTRILQLVTALTALLIGLLLSGLLTRGSLGFSLLQQDSTLSMAKDILQLLWSGLVVWLFVYAWSKPVQIHNKKTVPKQKASRKSELKKGKPTFNLPRWSLPKIRIELPGFLKGDTWLRIKDKATEQLQNYVIKIKAITNWRFGVLKKSANLVRLNPTLAGTNANTNKLRLSRSSSSIKLVGDEEHICPYCLETVTKLDPRGRRICHQCKTWHHLDCWDVTGECQVPHQH
jgi:hypothetical protein